MVMGRRVVLRRDVGSWHCVQSWLPANFSLSECGSWQSVQLHVVGVHLALEERAVFVDLVENLAVGVIQPVGSTTGS